MEGILFHGSRSISHSEVVEGKVLGVKGRCFGDKTVESCEFGRIDDLPTPTPEVLCRVEKEWVFLSACWCHNLKVQDVRGYLMDIGIVYLSEQNKI